MTKIKKLPLSVAIITLNEEDRLADCLKSVDFADDIVVVDSGSTDNTVKIAEQFKARVFSQDWLGFGPQKQFAIDQCKHDWVLILDADERIPPETEAEIRSLLASATIYVAFSFPRKNFFMAQWIKHGGWWPDRVIRLALKKSCRYKPQLVHETLKIEGYTGKVNSPIEHYTSRNLQQTIDKMNHYSSAGAQELFKKKFKANPFIAFSRSIWAFFHNYFLRLGFLDGFSGLVISVSSAINIFFKYAKLIELQNETKK